MTTLNYSPADGLQASPEGTAGWRDHGPSQAGLAARRASSADIPFVLLIQSGRQTPLRPLQGLRTAATRPRSLDARPPEEIRLRPYRIFVVAAVFAEPARRRAAPDIVHGERNFRVAARIKRSLMSFLTAISPSYSPRDCSQPRPLSGNVFWWLVISIDHTQRDTFALVTTAGGSKQCLDAGGYLFRLYLCCIVLFTST